MSRRDRPSAALIVPGPVLLVCNDRETGDLWAYALRRMGLEVSLTVSAGSALAEWEQETFGLVLIDVCGPDLDGIELARQLRTEAANPILLFTTQDDDALPAYQAGVDECVVKPVSPSLFLAKVRAWLRHAWTVPTGTLDRLGAGPLQLDPASRSVQVEGGTLVKLTNLEFRLLYLLLSNPGQTLPADLIIDRVWGCGEGDSRLLKNVVYRLRRKIEGDPGRPKHIQTGAAGGYLFTP